jgi:hypothetical protein
VTGQDWLKGHWTGQVTRQDWVTGHERTLDRTGDKTGTGQVDGTGHDDNKGT